MITTPEIIAIMGTALGAVLGCLGWAVQELRRVRALFAMCRDSDKNLMVHLTQRNMGLRAENRAFKAAEAKRQAQRIAASAAAARARAAKGKS